MHYSISNYVFIIKDENDYYSLEVVLRLYKSHLTSKPFIKWCIPHLLFICFKAHNFSNHIYTTRS